MPTPQEILFVTTLDGPMSVPPSDYRKETMFLEYREVATMKI